jgi:hypothetical protein
MMPTGDPCHDEEDLACAEAKASSRRVRTCRARMAVSPAETEGVERGKTDSVAEEEVVKIAGADADDGGA